MHLYICNRKQYTSELYLMYIGKTMVYYYVMQWLSCHGLCANCIIKIVFLTHAPLGVLDFHALLWGVEHTPSNSAPETRSDTGKAALERASKIRKKWLRSSFWSGRRSGHQRSLALLVAGSWLPLLVAGGAVYDPRLISRDLTDRFSKCKRHSIPLNVICMYKKYKFEKYK